MIQPEVSRSRLSARRSASSAAITAATEKAIISLHASTVPNAAGRKMNNAMSRHSNSRSIRNEAREVGGMRVVILPGAMHGSCATANGDGKRQADEQTDDGSGRQHRGALGVRRPIRSHRRLDQLHL